jgi:lipopolysaccharide export system permease protein
MMPTRIDRYLFRQLLIGLIAVTVGLTALVWLVSSLRYVEVVVSHGQSLLAFLKLTAMKIPEFVAVILPIACFAVTLRIYLRLSDDREITVMRASGLSQWSLARPALGVAGVTVVAGYVLSLWIVPVTATVFREYLFQIRNQLDAFVLQEGVFNQITPQMMVYARAREADGTLRGIMVDDSRDKAHPYTVFAETGRLVIGAAGPQVVLKAGTRQEVDRQTGRLNVLSFSENVFDLSLPKGDIEQRVRDTGELGLAELLSPGSALAGRRDLPRLRGEAFKRMTSPLNTVGYVLIALICVLSGNFRRHAGLMRPLAAVAAVVGLVAIGLGTDSLIARRPELVGLLWVRAILPGVMAAAYLFWPRWTARTGLAPVPGR